MASEKTIRVEGLGGVAVSLIAAALAGLGVSRLVWVVVLVVGVCLGVFALIQFFATKREKGELPVSPLSRPSAPTDVAVVQTEGKSRYRNTHVKGYSRAFDQSGGELQSDGLYIDREPGGEEVKKHEADGGAG
jgi:hypothetical protein